MKEALPHFKSRPVRIAFLLVLVAGGLGVLVWVTMPKEQREVTGREQVVPPAPQPRSLQEILADRDMIPSHHHSLLGRQAPELELADSAGKVWRLTELQEGRPAVLIFYYGNHCIHCVGQLSDIDRDLPLFQEVGARIVAVSADPPEFTPRRFQKNGAFGFSVLSDPENKTALAYGAFRWAPDGKLPNTLRHGTFLIDRDGIVRWVNIGDMPLRRNSALLYQLAKIEGTLP